MAEASKDNIFVSLLGDKLVSKMGADASSDETVDTASATAGKDRVALYFSAHWCPPCRGFTPVLAKTYNKIKEDGKNFEIVFVSSDRDRGACKEYHDEQPWLVLPYDERDVKAKLSKKFKVSGIPALIILDGEGNLVSDNGRNFVTEDPDGAEFPWSPPTVSSCLGDTLVGPTGEDVKVASLAGKSIALYFSAHWCPPCRGFTPELVKTYNAMKASGRDDFEFIFVSSDRDADAFDEYRNTMPWLALPFANRDGKSKLSNLFGVRGIPCLVTLESIESGKIINKGARSACSADKTGTKFPWAPEPVNDVETGGSDLNENPCLVVMLAGADPVVAVAAKENLEKVGKAYHAAAKARGEEGEIKFFYEAQPGGLSEQIRKLTKQPAEGAAMILLDIPDEGGYYVAEEVGDAQAMLDAYAAKTLTRQQLS